MTSSHFYKFGPFRLDPAERQLMRDSKPVALTPKCFDLLVVLVENGGHLLEKEKLIATLWPDHFVEESNLSFNISTLRKALGEGPGGQQYIETVPKKGFRFVGQIEEHRGSDTRPVSWNPDGAVPARQRTPDGDRPAERSMDAGNGAQPATLTRPSRGLRVLFLVVAAGMVGFLAYQLLTRRVYPPIQKPPRTIAVLPFKPLSADSRNESLEMGMAETLINRLSGINEIVVRPMSAVRKYTDPQQDIAKAGQELQAEAVLDGSIQKAGERVRLTVRLVSVQTGATIWAEQFDTDFTDIFKVQDSISERVTQALTLKLNGVEREQLTKRSTDNSEAYQLYLQGRYLFSKQTGDSGDNFRNSLKYFQQALEKDPKFAPAYVGISEFYITDGPNLIALSPQERLTKAKAAVVKALELDDSLAEAHNALAEIKYQYEYDWLGAEEDFKRAVDLNPNVAFIRLAYGWYLMCQGRFDQAHAQMEKAQELDPVSLQINRARGTLLLYRRQYDQAINYFLKLREAEPTAHRTHLLMSVAYEKTGRQAEAVEESLEHGRSLGFLTSEQIGFLRKSFKTSGWHGFLQGRIVLLEQRSKTDYMSPNHLAGLYSLLGEKDHAFAWLEKALNERDPAIVKIKIDPIYDNLRSDPRFIKLLQRINLTP